MNGHEFLAPILGGGAGFMGLIRWVQGGLAKKVDKTLFDERTENMQADIGEIKGTVVAVAGKVDSQTTTLALIQQSIQNIETRSHNTREG